MVMMVVVMMVMNDIDIDGRLIFHLQKIPAKIQPDQLYHWLCKEQFNTLMIICKA